MPDDFLTPEHPDGFVFEATPAAVVDLGALRSSDGALLILRNAFEHLAHGDVLEVRSAEPSARVDLLPWVRLSGNEVIGEADAGGETRFFLRKRAPPRTPSADWGTHLPRRDGGAIDVRDWLVGRAGQIEEVAPTYFGFVPRGAVQELPAPTYPYSINRRLDVWSDNLGDLYEQAKTQQWDATHDIPWATLKPLPDRVEWAVCQLMTFLAENEYAALYIPGKFLPRINAHYVEAVLFLATIINDEARHIEAFTKRALANGGGLQTAASLTEYSLHGLLIQDDYFRSSFLLHVLGEGTFLDLLEFIERHAPDPATREVVRRARLDEGRHVAYGIGHVRDVLASDPARSEELVAAAEERAETLQAASGANPAVMEALAILAAGSDAPSRLGPGFAAVQDLFRQMHAARVRRMLQIGLDQPTAEKISQLHTPNFM
jgi:TusA-related sulfurtransferase